MRLLVCGSRHWKDFDIIARELTLLKPTVIIHGGQVTMDMASKQKWGADYLAGVWAELAGVPCEVFPANWDKYGVTAGPIRNKRMLMEGRLDRVGAFLSAGFPNRGTKDMVRRARAAGLPVCEIHASGLPRVVEVRA